MQKSCVHQLKVLADETRLSVLTLLMERPQYVGELNQVLGIEQSLLSHHLKVLRQKGFVTAVRQGKAVLYQLADTLQPPHEPNRADGNPADNPASSLNLGCCVLVFDEKPSFSNLNAPSSNAPSSNAPS